MFNLLLFFFLGNDYTVSLHKMILFKPLLIASMEKLVVFLVRVIATCGTSSR